MRGQGVRGHRCAGLHVVCGYHDGVGGQACRNAGATGRAGGSGCAGSTLSGAGAQLDRNTVITNVAISTSVSVSQLLLVFMFGLLRLGLVDGLLMGDRRLGYGLGGSLSADVSSVILAPPIGLGHRTGVEVPAQQCQHPDDSIRCEAQPDHDIASWAMIEAPTLPEKPEGVVIATVRMSGAFPCTVL